MIEGLGNIIRLLRQKQNLSQAELAKSLSITPALISAYELGERVPSLSNLIKLASFFRVSSDYLLGLKPYHELSLDGLSPQDTDAILTLISSLKKK